MVRKLTVLLATTLLVILSVAPGCSSSNTKTDGTEEIEIDGVIAVDLGGFHPGVRSFRVGSEDVHRTHIEITGQMPSDPRESPEEALLEHLDVLGIPEELRQDYLSLQLTIVHHEHRLPHAGHDARFWQRWIESKGLIDQFFFWYFLSSRT